MMRKLEPRGRAKLVLRKAFSLGGVAQTKAILKPTLTMQHTNVHCTEPWRRA